MAEENDTSTQELSLDLSESDIAELVQGIERECIIELVKHNKHLQQHVFRGFRPDHLPWGQVPSRLARDASGDSHKVEIILNLWRECSTDLLEEVNELPPDNLRAGVIELLIRHGIENKAQVLWALRLDSRPELQEALKEGLDQELSGEVSSLISQAQSTLLAETLEVTQKQLAEAEEEGKAIQEELEDLRRLSQHKTQQVEKWRASYEEVNAEKEQLQAKVVKLEEQQQADRSTIADLQHKLEDEQTAAQELRRSVADLKATLRAQAEAREVDEVLLALEEERKASAGFRLKNEKLQQRLEEAYTKRDEALAEAETLKQELERTHYDKDVIIEQKRRIQTHLEEAQDELKELRTRRDDQAFEQVLSAIPATDLESGWLDARSAVRAHVHNILVAVKADGETRVELDKAALWQEWAEREISLVKDMLTTLEAYPETGILPDQGKLKAGQQLLALRWYLLEYTARAIQQTELQAFAL